MLMACKFTSIRFPPNGVIGLLFSNFQGGNFVEASISGSSNRILSPDNLHVRQVHYFVPSSFLSRLIESYVKEVEIVAL